MPHVRRFLSLILIGVMILAITPSFVHAQGGDQYITHTVKAGENLSAIARQYSSTVAAIAAQNNITNPNLIFVGQVLKVPTGVQLTVTPTLPGPTATPVVREVVHVVQPGENLFRIALRYNLLTSIVAAYNNIANPSLIYVGQRIRIPTGGYVPAPAVTPVPGTTPAPNDAVNVGFAYGVQVHLPGQNQAQVVEMSEDLGVGWIKQQVEWSVYEPTAGNINWEPLDDMIDAIENNSQLNILLTVSSAPDWARATDQEKGPPTDYNTYASFVGKLAARYKGRVQAYEVWNEPNLRREWNTPLGISASSYVELLRLAYNAIKNADSAAIVVSGAPSPTGFNDGVNAISDRVYLRQMYQAGVAQWSDAIGAHPNGWANPPDSTCCRNDRPDVNGWDEDRSFFFRDTLADYRQIMVQNGDSGTYIWATEFGWGSNDGLNVDPPDDFGFVVFTSVDEQAEYAVDAFELGRELGYVGPMFLWNLNFCTVVGQTGEQCLWSALDPAGSPRPLYLAVRDALTGDGAPAQPAGANDASQESMDTEQATPVEGAGETEATPSSDEIMEPTQANTDGG